MSDTILTELTGFIRKANGHPDCRITDIRVTRPMFDRLVFEMGKMSRESQEHNTMANARRYNGIVSIMGVTIVPEPSP